MTPAMTLPMTLPMTAALALAMLSALGLPAAEAAVEFTSQFRLVSTFAVVDLVDGENLNSNDSFQSVELGVFDQMAVCHADVPAAEVDANAAQLSYITDGLILAEAGFTAQSEVSAGANFAEGLGLSRFESRFTVDVPTEVHLQSALFAAGNGVANLLFRVAGGEILLIHNIRDGSMDVDEVYLLQPGPYELVLSTSGYGQAFEGGGSPASGSIVTSLLFPVAASVAASDPARVAVPTVSPNPFQRGARLSITYASDDRLDAPRVATDLTVYDATGRVVRRFAQVTLAGVDWDARDEFGREVPAGVYLVRTGNGAATRAVVLR